MPSFLALLPAIVQLLEEFPALAGSVEELFSGLASIGHPTAPAPGSVGAAALSGAIGAAKAKANTPNAAT